MTRSTFALAFALATLGVATGLAQPSPQLFLSLRGIENRTTEVGEPVFVAVRVEAPVGSAMKLSSGQASWTEAVTVELVGVGVSGAVRATVLQEGPAEVSLDEDNAASEVWWVSSSHTAALTPGTYELRARIDRAGASAAGYATLPLRIMPAGSALAPVQRAVALATEQLAQNRPEAAVKILDPLLEKDPDNARLLTARAQACVMGEDWLSARLCIERALVKATATSAGYPPIELTLMQQQLQALAPDISTTDLPPAWTRLPERLLVRDWERAPRHSSSAAVALPPPVAPSPAVPVSTPRPPTPVPAPAPATASSIPSPSAVPPPAIVAPAARVTPPASSPPSTAPTARPALVGVVIPANELTDALVVATPAGQWAVSATAGSQYGRATQYSASQATGAPNVRVAGNTPDAWCPAVPASGMDWLEVTFAEPVRATEVRVRQNDTPGAIVKVEAFEPDGTPHVWWQGVDPHQPGRVREIVWFGIRVPPTPYVVTRVKLTLNLASGPGYKQVDAVQLVRVLP